MSLKKIFRFALDNYFIVIFLAAVAFVGVVSIYKLFFVKSTYVYAKVKIGQGLWWASTAKPPIWLVRSLQKQQQEKDLLGKPIAEILSVRYYPWWGSNQYDVYLTLKLKVSKLGKTGKYNFKRSTIGVGSPVDLEFSSNQLSGTITQLSSKPFKERYLEKEVTLTKKGAWPWEYDAIKIGDRYFDGVDDVFVVLDKTSKDTANLAGDVWGNYPEATSEQKKYIIVRARVKVKMVDGQLVFGEEQILTLGKSINISTANFTFSDYIISKIE